jgi:hypothetical protein
MSDALLDLWADELSEALIRDLPPQTVELIAAAASTSAMSAVTGLAAPTLTIAQAGLATGGTGLAGLSTLAKVGVTTVAIVVGTGVAAVTGTLPDPVQSWIADVMEEIGISLPTPDESTPTIPVDRIPLPGLPLDGTQFPIPELPLDGDHIPIPDLPYEDASGSGLPLDASNPVPDLLPDGLAEPPTVPSDDKVDASAPDPTLPAVPPPPDSVAPPSAP